MKAYCPNCYEERQVPFRNPQRPRCAVCGTGLVSLPRRPRVVALGLRPSRHKPVRSRPISGASPAQRAKVRDLPCVFCGLDRNEIKIDPAHIAAQGYPGGCGAALCTIPLCRLHHRQFDDGRLDLLPLLVGRYGPELGHALEHYGGDLIGLLQRVTGERWIPVSEVSRSA